MTQCAPPPCDLDEEYYWDFVTFSARGRLFRVPKYRLISESEHFASKYGLDGDSGSENEYGTVEDPHLNAVKLDDVSADEFRSFLKAVYPKVVHGDLTLTKDEWLSVLKLSTKWLFNDLRKRAIEELSCFYLDPIEQIQLGKEYNVEAWLLSGCHELVSRDSVISIEDAEKINWKVAINLYIIRDGVKTDALANVQTINDQVRNVFSTDFERIESCQSMYLTAEEKLREIREEEERREEEGKKKQEAEEEARREAESHRLEVLAAEEEKRIAELALELENRRRQLHSIGTTPTTPTAITPEEPKAQASADYSLPIVDEWSLAKSSTPPPGVEEDNGGTNSGGTTEESPMVPRRRDRSARKAAKKRADAAEEVLISAEDASMPQPLLPIASRVRIPLSERLSKHAPSEWPPAPATETGSSTGKKEELGPLVSSFWK